MPPKKKDKGKSSDWLQCLLCKKLISPECAGLHSVSCNADHGFIQGKILLAKVVNAEAQKSEDGSLIAKSIRDKDSTVWLAIPTMQICGLSIGQPCIVNKVVVKRAWPLKSLPLASVALTDHCKMEMGVVEGELITVERFFPKDRTVLTADLILKEPRDIFETEEFCAFAASSVDGLYIREGTPLAIRYFGQFCSCTVGNVVTTSPSLPVDSANNSPQVNLKFSNDHHGLTSQILTPTKQAVHSASPKSSSATFTDKIDSHVSLPLPGCDLSDSLGSLDISDLSQSDLTSTPKSSLKQNFPNLVTPKKDADSKITPDLNFAKVSSVVTKFMVSTAYASDRKRNGKGNPELSLKDIGGLSSHLEELKNRIHRAQQPGSASHCILLYGPPGTGKTLLVKALTSDLGMHTIHLAGTDIWSKLFGEAESNLRKNFKAAQDRAPSIIVIDDIDVICPKRSQNQGGQQEHRIVGTLLSLLDGSSTVKNSSDAVVVVIGITNNKDGLDPALRRAGRFGCEIEVGVPTSVQRKEILEVILSKLPHQLSPEDIETAARNAHGYVGADLAALVNEGQLLIRSLGWASMHYLNRYMPASQLQQPPNSIKLELEDLVYAGSRVKPSALREIQLEVPQVRWSDVGGMSEVKMRLREAVELPLSNPEVFKRLGIEPPRGLLMYGPPGCSKTMVARALATECKLNFLAVKGPELFNQYVGESEKAIREIFRKARSAAPSILFFDEIDAIASKRGSSSGGSGVDDRVLTQLLTEMDGLEFLKDVFIMAATNRPDKIDRALIRPGRFDSLVYVPLPNAETRKEILEKKLSKMCIAPDVSVGKLVELTNDYSGAEIIQVCQEAALFALREDLKAKEVLQRHFDEALQKVQPNIDEDLIRIYQEFSEVR